MNTQEMRELDAWIAEKVMGWAKVETVHELVTEQQFCKGGVEQNVWVLERERLNHLKQFHPTTSPAAAMMVLERCAENGVLNGEFKCPVSIFRRGDMMWVLSEDYSDEPEDTDRHYIVVQAETLPLAICLFAKRLFEK